jgi:hypothetical protein
MFQLSGYVHNSMHYALGENAYGLAVIQFLGATGDVPLLSKATGNLAPPQTEAAPDGYGWVPFDVSETAPPGTERVRFWVNTCTPETSPGGGGLFYDSLSATVVPEVSPALWALLPIGLAAVRKCLRRRERFDASRTGSALP